jgi:SAM-dependent methyltransferase
MTEEALKELAGQLRRPEGDKGKEVAQMMHETNIGMTLNAIQHLALQDQDTILELGHGNAAHLAYLLGQAAGLSYQGLDISALMQEEARQINQSFVAERQASFALYDGVQIPFPDDTFDKAFTVNTIYFWESPQALLAEIYRVLQPGGVFCLTFAAADFMKQLPFTTYGFDLYDVARAQELVAGTAFRLIDTDLQEEQVKSNTGELVTRNFATLSLQK